MNNTKHINLPGIFVAVAVAAILFIIVPSSAKIIASSLPTLLVINHVNDTLGNKINSSDFRMVVVNLNYTNQPNRLTETFTFINGSDQGTKVTLNPGTFLIRDNTFVNKPLTIAFNKTFSGDCKPTRSIAGPIVPSGVIKQDETKTCRIDRVLLHR